MSNGKTKIVTIIIKTKTKNKNNRLINAKNMAMKGKEAQLTRRREWGPTIFVSTGQFKFL